MRQLIWGKTFARDLKRAIKKQPTLQNEFEQTLKLFSKTCSRPHWKLTN
jgi:mRNA-degrading endonuclease YafQ of YafQ-DinJ toxin-antitoxin module